MLCQLQADDADIWIQDERVESPVNIEKEQIADDNSVSLRSVEPTTYRACSQASQIFTVEIDSQNNLNTDMTGFARVRNPIECS
jgi:hypothetical protein